MTGKGTKMVIRLDRNAGKASCDRDTQPNLRCVLGVSVFHTSSNSDLDYSPIFNVRTDVNACDCTRVCTDTFREFALKVDSGRKIPCRTGQSNLRQRRAGPTFYQLSYTPNHNRRRSFSHAAPSVWNSLPRESRNIQSTTAFRTALKTNLFKSYLY